MSRVEKKYNEKLSELKKYIKNDRNYLETLEKTFASIKAMDDNVFNLRINHGQEYKESLRNNTSFISDDDASHISWHVTQRIVTLKSLLIDILNKSQMHLSQLRSMEKFDSNVASETSYELVELVVKSTKQIFPLIEQMKRIRNKSVWALTTEEMTSLT